MMILSSIDVLLRVSKRVRDKILNRKNITRQLFFLPALLSLWLIISSALLAWLDPENFLILILFIMTACVLCLSYRMRTIGWALAVIGSAIYFVIHISQSGVTGSEIRLISLGVISLLGAAVLCTFTAEQLNDITTQVRYSRRMIEELRIIDPVSGLTRFHYARKNLSTEVARSQRYGKNLCLIIARVADWNDLVERRGPDASQQIMAQVGDQFNRTIRNTDIAMINIEKIGVILPETKIEGAIRVAQRIVENCSRKVKVELNIGIASFPDDANLDTDLIRNAEAALQISMSSGQPIVMYAQIKAALEQENRAELSMKRMGPVHPESTAPDLTLYRRVAESDGDGSNNIQRTLLSDDMPAEFFPGSEGEGFPSYLSEGQTSGRGKNPPKPIGHDSHNSEMKTGWVKPYNPPVSNLELESKPDGDEDGKPAPKIYQQVPVGIIGILDIEEIPVIEKAFQSLPTVTGITVLDYKEGTLIINLTHTSENILAVLKDKLALPYINIHGGSGWIEVSLKKRDDT
jgi:diguanylate cyclase (GGDEF)-like protein